MSYRRLQSNDKSLICENVYTNTRLYTTIITKTLFSWRVQTDQWQTNQQHTWKWSKNRKIWIYIHYYYTFNQECNSEQQVHLPDQQYIHRNKWFTEELLEELGCTLTTYKSSTKTIVLKEAVGLQLQPWGCSTDKVTVKIWK